MQKPQTAGMVALTLVVILAGCTGGFDLGPALLGQETITAPCDDDVMVPSSDRLDDPQSDILGWENGVWYNESLQITQTDGLSCGELEFVLSRTMARVEHIRGVEFDTTPTVTIIPREAFKEQVTGGDRSVSADRRAFMNAKYEALFLINESADAVAVQRRNRGATVSGVYIPDENTIVLVTDDITNARVHEGVLAHELVHALQDQSLSDIEYSGIEDTAAAHRGVTEGDANFVEYLHERHCEGPWLGSCLQSDRRDEKSGSNRGIANIGLYVLNYQPYSDGPPFIKRIRDRGSWAAVNDLYNNPPASTEQTIHPRRYPDEKPRRIELQDRSSDRWTRIGPEDQPAYETWGERGLFVMFLDPTFESNREDILVQPDSFLTPNGSALDPYNYSNSASSGWDGDRLLVYRNENDDLAYTWKIAFDSRSEAREFITAYRDVLRFREANQVNARSNVWRIPKGESFADAFYVRQRGDTVLIVNAPTIEALQEIRENLDEERRTGNSRSNEE